MTCERCGKAIVGSLLKRTYHRQCRDRGRAERQQGRAIERRIEAILQQQRRLRRAA